MTAFSTNGAGSTRGQYVGERKLVHSYLLIQISSPRGSRTSYKTRYTESNRKEIGEEPGAHGHRGRFQERNTNGLCSKIKN